jgi:hypothetical protein
MTTDTARVPKNHTLKTWPQFYDEVETNRKRHEMRKDDRDFHAGDTLTLVEWDPETKEFTGKSCVRTITYLMRDFPGIEKGYCLMSIAPPHPAPDARLAEGERLLMESVAHLRDCAKEEIDTPPGLVDNIDAFLAASTVEASPVKQAQPAVSVEALTAHRACCGSEADPAQGKLHGYCIVCGVPWPCETARLGLPAPKPDAGAGGDEATVNALRYIIDESVPDYMEHGFMLIISRAILAAIRAGKVPGIYAARFGHLDELQNLRAQVAELTRERDLAIAHDRQPYPTADAYERVCAALAAAKEAHAAEMAKVRLELEDPEDDESMSLVDLAAAMKCERDAAVARAAQAELQLVECSQAVKKLGGAPHCGLISVAFDLRDQLAKAKARRFVKTPMKYTFTHDFGEGDRDAEFILLEDFEQAIIAAGGEVA